MKFENLRFIIGENRIDLNKKMTKFLLLLLLLFRLMPQRALSHDGKKHVTTVPVRLRKLHTLPPVPKHEGKLRKFE